MGKTITVEVTHTDAQGTEEPALTSSPTTAVVNANDPTTGSVSIDGTPTEGQTLTANTSDLSDLDGIGTFATNGKPILTTLAVLLLVLIRSPKKKWAKPSPWK